MPSYEDNKTHVYCLNPKYEFSVRKFIRDSLKKFEIEVYKEDFFEFIESFLMQPFSIILFFIMRVFIYCIFYFLALTTSIFIVIIPVYVAFAMLGSLLIILQNFVLHN